MEEDMDSWSDISLSLSLFDFFLFFFFEGLLSGPVSRRFRLLGPGTGEDDLCERNRLKQHFMLRHEHILITFCCSLVHDRSPQRVTSWEFDRKQTPAAIPPTACRESLRVLWRAGSTPYARDGTCSNSWTSFSSRAGIPLLWSTEILKNTPQ